VDGTSHGLASEPPEASADRDRSAEARLGAPGQTFDVDLDRLEVVRALGAGAFGEVLLARRRLPDGGVWPVALKVLREADPRRVERFRCEAELTARLDHPGIVRVHGAGSYRGRPAIVYGFVEGARPLSEAARTLPLVTRLACARDVAAALAYAHERGVVHRDVKAENVLVDPDGRTLLADFGLAVGIDSRTLTQTGQLLGTPYAMSPEQLVGKEATAASDVWGLGVLLHLVITGERPFEGDTWTTLAAEVLRGDAARPSARVAGLPAGIDALVAGALAKEPGERPSAAEVADALEAALVAGPEAPRRSALPALVAVAGLAVALGVAALLASGGGQEATGAAPVTTSAAPVTTTSGAPVATTTASRDPRAFVGWVEQFAERTPFRLTVEQRAVGRDDVGHRLRLDGVLGPYSPETSMKLDKVTVGMLTLVFTAMRAEDLGMGHVFDSSEPGQDGGPLPDLTRYARGLSRCETGLLLNPRNGQIMGHSGFPARPNVRSELPDPSSTVGSAWGAGIPDDRTVIAAFQNLTQLLCLDHQPGRRRRLALTPADALEAPLRLVEVEPGRLRIVADAPLQRVGKAPTGDRPTFSGRVLLSGGKLEEVAVEVEFDTAGQVPPDAVRRRVTMSLRLGQVR
jgi:hypothetical protein